MADIPLEVIARRIGQLVTDFYLADETQFTTCRGRFAEIKDILAWSKIEQADLVGALGSIDFTTNLATSFIMKRKEDNRDVGKQ